MKRTYLVAMIAVFAVGTAGGWFAASTRYAERNQGVVTEHKEETAGHRGEEKDAHAEDGHEGHGHAAETAESGEYCSEHKMDEAVDALCNPDLIPPLQPGKGVLVRLGTPDAAARAGVSTLLPEKVAAATGPAFPAQTIYSPSRVAQVSALTTGTVLRLKVDAGAAVVKGQVLAEIASSEISTARAELSTAQSSLELVDAQLQREEDLFARGISSRQEVEEARAAQKSAAATLDAARQRVALYGGESRSGGSASFVLRSPLTGIVAERHVVAGETITADKPLFTVVDPAVMGIELSLPSDRIALVQIGTPIEAGIDGLTGERFTGRVTQVAAVLDSQTRLLKVLAEVENRGQLLKSGLFGEVRLLGAVSADTLEIPANAVQAIDGNPFVFIEKESDLFELRRVATGPRRGRNILIAEGLKADEKVVATQGFALKSEVLKSRLGASCADH